MNKKVNNCYNTMEAKELRVGNYVLETNIVNYDDCNSDYYPDEILIVGKHLFTYEHEDIKPIPLTEEWLLKFGFELGENFYIKNNVSVEIDELYLWDVFLNNGTKETHLRSIKYIHQLQNLYFALTNEELTIK